MSDRTALILAVGEPAEVAVRSALPARVEPVRAGAEALRRARECPDLIVLDGDPPDLTGLELCRRLKSDPVTAAIPVLMVADDPARLDGELTGPGGPDVVLARPSAPSALAASADTLVHYGRRIRDLRRSAGQWTAAFDALGEGLAILDGAGVVRSCNRALAQILRCPAERVEGRPIAELLGELDGGQADRPFERAVRTRRRASAEWSSDRRTFRVLADPMLAADGAVTGVVATLADITNQKRLRAQADQAETDARAGRLRIEQLEREARVMQHFAAAAAPAPAATAEPLREADDALFCELVGDYERLLEQMLEQREFKVYNTVSADLRAMADRLGLIGAGPRDVVEIHGMALRRRSATLPPVRAHALAEEGRLLVLELMGHLASHYRSRAAGPRLVPNPAATTAEPRKPTG